MTTDDSIVDPSTADDYLDTTRMIFTPFLPNVDVKMKQFTSATAKHLYGVFTKVFIQNKVNDRVVDCRGLCEHSWEE